MQQGRAGPTFVRPDPTASGEAQVLTSCAHRCCGPAGRQCIGPIRPPAPASAQLPPTKGNTTSGEVRLTQQGDKVVVTGEIRGLKPHGEHGFPVHDKGDCSSGGGMRTGGHYNPMGHRHQSHGRGEHHAGDLPSLKADATGHSGPRLACAVISRSWSFATLQDLLRLQQVLHRIDVGHAADVVHHDFSSPVRPHHGSRALISM